MEYLILAIIAGIVGAAVANKKGRSGCGWFILCMFIPLLAIIPFFLSPVPAEGKYAICPYCRETIKWDATVCKHCKRELSDEFE